MTDPNEELKERMSVLSDESLRKIVEKDSDKYEEYAVELARKELEKRPNTKFTELITFKDLLENIEFDEVVEVFKDKYPEKLSYLKEYRKIYESLLKMNSVEGNSDFLHIEKYNVSKKVYGVDGTTGEKYGVEFCSWSQWLSFRLKPEQIDQIGKARFAAICLMTLTTYGCTEEEIQGYFNSIQSVNISENISYGTDEQNLITFNPITLDKSLAHLSDFKEKIIAEGENNSDENQEGEKVHPWVRFWARTIDNTTLVMIIGYFMIFIIPTRYYTNTFGIAYVGGTIFSITRYIIWSFLEALFISKLGWTPGKWILNIRVLKPDGTKLSYTQALERVYMVMLLGEGLFIPLINLITNLFSYSFLNRNGAVKWDEKLEVSVSHKDIEPIRIVIAVAIIVGIPIFTNSSLFGQFFYSVLTSR